jgi:hypothetical protein
VHGTVEGQRPVSEEHRAIAQALDGRCIVRDEHDRPAALLERGDHAEALPLEALVADCEHLVEQQHVGLQEGGDREPEPHGHAGGVRPNRPVDCVLELRERDYLVEPLADSRP